MSKLKHNNETTPTIESINDLICEIIAKANDGTPTNNPNPDWADLDSLMKLELIDHIQQNYKLEFSDNDIESIKNKNDLLTLIKKNQSRQKKRLKKKAHRPYTTNKSKLALACLHPLRNLIFFIIKSLLSIKTNTPPKIEGNYILASNHTSHLDSLLLMLCADDDADNFVLMGAKDYYFDSKKIFPFFARKLFNIAPYSRGISPDHMRTNLKMGLRCLYEKNNIILFPEGTRSLTGKLGPFKSGLAMLAYHSKVPIIPCHIKGSYEVLPKGNWLPTRGKVELRFGEPILIDSFNFDGDDDYAKYRAIMQKLQQHIEQLAQENE